MALPSIQNSGLTPQRDVVLSVIRDAMGHLTASEVFSAAREKLPTISFATVYNSLKFLKENGYIGEIQFGNGASRFDAMTHRHDHALCTGCGALVDIDMELPEELVRQAAEFSRFRPEYIEFTLRGKCPKCTGTEYPAWAPGSTRGYKEKQQSRFGRKLGSKVGERKG